MPPYKRVLDNLKEAAVRSPPCIPEELDNFRPAVQISFLSNVLEQMDTDQIQVLLEKTGFLDPF